MSGIGPSMPPEHALKAKEFEELCIYRAQKDEASGLYCMGRYGVQGVFMRDKKSGSMGWRPVQSYPDFEGVAPGGRQFIFDCKVCSQASYDLTGGVAHSFLARQYSHLKKRASFGAVCFLLIHFNGRVLKTKIEEVVTRAIPVYPEHPFWQAFERHEEKTLSRQKASLYGVEIPWNLATERSTKPTPDIAFAVSACEKVQKGKPAPSIKIKVARKIDDGE